MNFKYHLESAWKMTLEHIVALILMTLTMIALSFITLGVLAPVLMAEYMQSILLMVKKGREPRIQDVFSQMRLFFPLLLFGIVFFIITMIGLMLLFLPGVLFAIAGSFCCIYMLPLMTDRNMGLIDAVKESFSMVTKEKLVDHIVVFILFIGISAIGSSIFIGCLFTQPLATTFLMSVYLSLIKTAPKTPSEPPPGPPPLNRE